MNKLSYRRKSRLIEKLAGLPKGITSRLHPRVQRRARAGIVPNQVELAPLPTQLRQRVISHFAGRNASRFIGLGRAERRHGAGGPYKPWIYGTDAGREIARGRRVAAATNPSDEFLFRNRQRTG